MRLPTHQRPARKRVACLFALITVASACIDASADPEPAGLDADASADVSRMADATDATADALACNGHPELCDRRFDEVVFVGTHNSMASDEDGFFAPNHTWSIERQLEDGVRAMLIDTYRDRDGLALCHGSCQLGRLDAVEELTTIVTFLEEHPREVMAFIFQDGISMDDSVALFEDSGLKAMAMTPPDSGEPWPTLAELIAADTRVLLTHESGGSGPEWYPGAWSVFVDTPYSFSSVEDFSCAQNRGPADAPLRLLNHWLGAPLPLPDLAERANRYEVLGERARACSEGWGRPPTIVAVDFYEIGAVFDVVDELNGVGQGRTGDREAR